MYEVEKATLTTSAGSQWAGQVQGNPVQEDTLASITPRVLVRSKQVAERSNQIAASLGIVPPSPPSGNDALGKAPQPTLINALREMENALDFTLGRLDSIHQHING